MELNFKICQKVTRENSETNTINSKNNKDNEERKEYFKFGRPKFDEVLLLMTQRQLMI